MVLVPAGEFTMGSNNGDADEQPVHKVFLDTFFMDKYEVTNQDFTVFLNDNYERVTLSDPYYLIDGREAFSLSCDAAYNPDFKNQCSLWRDKISDDLEKKQFVAMPTDKDHPIVIVTWYGAMEYCKWRSDEALTVTLPTEAQWEKAARGTHEILYPWGNEKNCKYANYKGCVGNVSSVGSYTSGISPYGSYDMAGNVWEWVSDWYDGNYYASLSSNISVNPLGPIDGEAKVFRGGSWFYDADFARTTQRALSVGDINTYSSLTVGFRCSGMP
jgi:formylglycine-generating enzyme required for sulfatase activity